MKKKIFALMLIFVMMLTSTIHTYALESGVTKFSISPIEADQKYRYIKVNITAPKTVANSRLLVGFYDRDSKLLSLTSYDISAKKEFKDQTINTSVTVKTPSRNYFEDRTPEIIKIFTWNKNNLAPKTLCDNVLTPEVIKNANAEVVEMLKTVPEATQFIREEHLIWESDVEDGIADSWDTHLFPIMDYIDLCAKGALEDSEDHLLTSLYAQARYENELNNIRRLFSQAPAEQKAKMTDLLNPVKLKTEYYDALNNAMKFLDFTITNKK